MFITIAGNKELPASGVRRVKGAASFCANTKLAGLGVVAFDLPPARLSMLSCNYQEGRTVCTDHKPW